MKIVFAGTPSNAATTLKALLDASFQVVGVLTRTDALVGRKKVLTPSPVAVLAESLELPVLKTNTLDEQALSWLQAKKPDLGVIVAYGSILRKSALVIPAKGWINLHYSLLPNYPGAAPVQHAIKDGLEATGVTVFRLDEGVDTGPILAQREVTIEATDNSADLLRKLTDVGAQLLTDTLSNLEQRISNQRIQNPTGQRTLASKIDRIQAKVNFDKSAIEINNLVRAMNPEPMSWFEHDGEAIRLVSARPAEYQDLGVAEASLIGGQVVVGCRESSLELLVVQPAGKNSMGAADWFRGLRQQKVHLS